MLTQARSGKNVPNKQLAGRAAPTGACPGHTHTAPCTHTLTAQFTKLSTIKRLANTLFRNSEL